MAKCVTFQTFDGELVCRRSCRYIVKDDLTCVCIASKKSMKSKVEMCDGNVRVAAYAFRHDGVLCHLHPHNRAFSLLQTSYIAEGRVTYDIRRTKRERVSARWTGHDIECKWSITVGARYKMHEQYVDKQWGPVIQCCISLSIFLKVSVVVYIA
jgi:hypothetical protein